MDPPYISTRTHIRKMIPMQLKPRSDKGTAATDRVNFFMRTGADLALQNPQPTTAVATRMASFAQVPTDRPSADDDDDSHANGANSSCDEPLQQPMALLLTHAVLEMMTSILLNYAYIYMPDDGHDHLKQYVGAACVFTTVMALKDSHYFFPDGCPLVTAMLWAATLYTDRRNRTRWDDIRARVAGQVVGWGVVLYLAHHNSDNLRLHADLLVFRSSLWVHSANEGIGTMLECIAITFATIPLTTPYDDDEDDTQPVDRRRRRGGSGTRAQGGGSGQLLKSKAEADPPTNDALFIAALSLAVIHYTLERIFEATMNPLGTCLQLYVRGETSLWQWLGPLLGQVTGALLAAVYVKLCMPSQDTVRKLLRTSKRK